ncbi:hypothetical protein [Persicobacter psychrovividus]|uniref:hypothetical protein n=1 Tax=Persicobacter psychrovividus TaxID=387638 RepID=UPI0030CA182B
MFIKSLMDIFAYQIRNTVKMVKQGTYSVFLSPSKTFISIFHKHSNGNTLIICKS